MTHEMNKEATLRIGGEEYHFTVTIAGFTDGSNLVVSRCPRLSTLINPDAFQQEFIDDYQREREMVRAE